MSPVPRGSPVTRGFHRKRSAGPAGRTPPGQYLTTGYNMYGDPWREQRYADD